MSTSKLSMWSTFCRVRPLVKSKHHEIILAALVHLSVKPSINLSNLSLAPRWPQWLKIIQNPWINLQTVKPHIIDQYLRLQPISSNPFRRQCLVFGSSWQLRIRKNPIHGCPLDSLNTLWLLFRCLCMTYIELRIIAIILCIISY